MDDMILDPEKFWPQEENDGIGEWDGEFPEPEAVMQFHPKWDQYYRFLMLSMMNTMITDRNPERDMRFQMQCDEEDCKWGPCNVTAGFDGKPCRRGKSMRKDGWYEGE
jgi:hypothetical protein